MTYQLIPNSDKHCCKYSLPHVSLTSISCCIIQRQHLYPKQQQMSPKNVGELQNNLLKNTQNSLVHNFIFCWPCIMLWFLLNDQRDAQFFSMYLFIFLTLYMFRAHCAHHQERQIVSIQPLVAVTLCRVQVGSELSTCIRHGYRFRVTATRGCTATICLSWWGARCARNM